MSDLVASLNIKIRNLETENELLRRHIMTLSNAAKHFIMTTEQLDKAVESVGASVDCGNNHENECCAYHGLHTMPHRGCVLR